MRYSRRDFGKLALAGLPAAAIWKAFGETPLAALDKIESKIGGVTIGAITYSFRTIQDPLEIIKAYTTIGLGEMELMSNHAEALAGIPRGSGGGGGGRRGGTPPTPEQIAARDAAAKAVQDWRTSATRGHVQAGAPEDRRRRHRPPPALLQHERDTTNRTARDADDEIEYAFMMAKWLGVEAISTSTQVSMAKRIAPFADKHKMMVGFHGHANTTDTNEVATPETLRRGDGRVEVPRREPGHRPLHRGRLRPRRVHPEAPRAHHQPAPEGQEEGGNGGGNGPWGTGDTPIKEVLKLVQKNKWTSRPTSSSSTRAIR